MGRLLERTHPTVLRPLLSHSDREDDDGEPGPSSTHETPTTISIGQNISEAAVIQAAVPAPTKYHVAADSRTVDPMESEPSDDPGRPDAQQSVSSIDLTHVRWNESSGHNPCRYLAQDGQGNYHNATYASNTNIGISDCPEVMLAIHRFPTASGRFRLESLPICPRPSSQTTGDPPLSVQDTDKLARVVGLWLETERKRRQPLAMRGVATSSGSEVDLTNALKPIIGGHLLTRWRDKSGEIRSLDCRLRVVESKVPVEELRGQHTESLDTDSRFHHGLHSFDMSLDEWPVYARRQCGSE